MSIRYVFNTGGNYVGFVANDSLFDTSGNWLGFLHDGNRVYDPSGFFLGYLMEDDRVARLDSEPPKPRVAPPLRPLTPLRPLPPLKRLPMVPLLPPWRDVFEKAGYGESRPRLFPASGGFFAPPQFQFHGLLGAEIVAADGTFLGEVSRSRTAPNSILNGFGPYGSAYSQTSIFNDYGPYGGRYGALSPYNDYSASPPRIVKNGNTIGLLSTNRYIGQAINPDELLQWLRGQ